MASPTFLQSISQNLALTWRRRLLQRISDERPEETDRGGEVNTVVDEGERSAASDVLPLSSRGAAYNDDKMIGGSRLDWEGSCSHSYHLLSVKDLEASFTCTIYYIPYTIYYM